MKILLVVLALFATSAGAVMPDPAVTPGERNPGVTQATVKTTICKAGWTKTIRPPVSYTNALKAKQLASGPYKSSDPPSAFEEDHLISLELGGHPTSEKNLWPEPYTPKDGKGARKKDRVESLLKRLVCSGQIKLNQAQREVLDWENTYRKRLGQ